MMKESFHQLGKLQEECNQELSDFQRDIFMAQEEFRATTSRLLEMMNEFSTSINTELDKLELRINHLEIVAMYAYQTDSTTILECPGAAHLAADASHIFIASNSGYVQSYLLPTLETDGVAERQSYDPLGTYGKITRIICDQYLFLGFSTGTIIAFTVPGLNVAGTMKYHTAPITAMASNDGLLVTGDNTGVVVQWSFENFQRIYILPEHRLSISSIYCQNGDWVITNRLGTITIHNHSLKQLKEKLILGEHVLYIFPHGDNQFITISDRLLVWEGKNIIKTFDAIKVANGPICAIKKPELLLLGSSNSKELTLIFLESLLFPKTVRILDSPPVSIIPFGSFFYVLTAKGTVVILRPSL